MNTHQLKNLLGVFLLALAGATLCGQAPTITEVHMVSVLTPQLTISSALGISNQIQYATCLGDSNWIVLTNREVAASPYLIVDMDARSDAARFYKVRALLSLPTNMVLIPGGAFTMGDAFTEGDPGELPTHTVNVSAFYMDKYHVTIGLWNQVCQWATNHGYSFDIAADTKPTNHPIASVTWHDAVKWCNARSEKEGRVPAYYLSAAQTNVYRAGQTNLDSAWVKWNSGYRLPTEAEWEKAARGGASGHRFPWANTDTIAHTQANYYAYGHSGTYDINPTQGYHPDYAIDGYPFTSPVGSFATNGYGLFDMAGNLMQWCWDWRDQSYYISSPATNPRGADAGQPGPARVYRGGSWNYPAGLCRTAYRGFLPPSYLSQYVGFRIVLPANEP